jgi:hypothetical protein
VGKAKQRGKMQRLLKQRGNGYLLSVAKSGYERSSERGLVVFPGFNLLGDIVTDFAYLPLSQIIEIGKTYAGYLKFAARVREYSLDSEFVAIYPSSLDGGWYVSIFGAGDDVFEKLSA